uniref:Ig-like domain-containing protein n=1 Tax=Macrostomum lignano TaxID=282301 RepID=A0A1I8FKB5_9PLAT
LVSGVASLEIFSASTQDSGRYSVRVKNAKGEDETQCKLDSAGSGGSGVRFKESMSVDGSARPTRDRSAAAQVAVPPPSSEEKYSLEFESTSTSSTSRTEMRSSTSATSVSRASERSSAAENRRRYPPAPSTAAADDIGIAWDLDGKPAQAEEGALEIRTSGTSSSLLLPDALVEDSGLAEGAGGPGENRRASRGRCRSKTASRSSWALKASGGVTAVRWTANGKPVSADFEQPSAAVAQCSVRVAPPPDEAGRSVRAAGDFASRRTVQAGAESTVAAKAIAAWTDSHLDKGERNCNWPAIKRWRPLEAGVSRLRPLLEHRRGRRDRLRALQDRPDWPGRCQETACFSLQAGRRSGAPVAATAAAANANRPRRCRRRSAAPPPNPVWSRRLRQSRQLPGQHNRFPAVTALCFNCLLGGVAVALSMRSHSLLARRDRRDAEGQPSRAAADRRRAVAYGRVAAPNVARLAAYLASIDLGGQRAAAGSGVGAGRDGGAVRGSLERFARQD